MSTTELSESVVTKLHILQEKLGANDLDSTLDKSLNIAYFVAETLDDPQSKLLIERHGRYQELKGIK